MKIIKIPVCLPENKGSDEAPDIILNHLKENYLNEDGSLPVFITDKYSYNIEEHSAEIFKDNSKIIIIGGDHSITPKLVAGFSRLYSNPGIMLFDAHPDADPDLKEQDLLRYLIKNNIIKKENIILFGVRSWKIKEYQFLKENKIRYFTVKNINEIGIELVESLMEKCRTFDALYISIDMDVLDISQAPGVNSPEPAGLMSRQLLFYLSRLNKLKNLKAIDIVEVNPKKDINEMTSKLAAKIIMEMY